MEDIKIIKNQSTIEERKIVYEWKINQFLSITSSPMNCASPDSIIESPVFSTSNIRGDSSWRLKIFHQKDRQFIRGEQAYQTFEIRRDCNAQNVVEVSELNNEKDKYVPDDTLTVSLELTELIVRSNTSQPTTKLRLGESKQIVDDLKDLFHSKEGSDVVLIVGDKKIPAHKTLLVSRSPVFSAMFKHKLKENQENEVDIPDMDPDICEKLLEFIYTDNVTDFDQFFERLYEPADKYQIPALKKVCEELLYKNVNVENAVQYLVLLDRHNADQHLGNSMPQHKLDIC
ncbi:speckle-type POZ protein-like B [Microplitis mediator]|uniref:speckle-type POZ protein-like B n=1 Tax=Microplitis mediator TaxID=375433 RepID=UPI002553547E|nr:speckle-type POZ protein-like B [Microplitis mediator]